jgi:hypothetical protein
MKKYEETVITNGKRKSPKNILQKRVAKHENNVKI